MKKGGRGHTQGRHEQIERGRRAEVQALMITQTASSTWSEGGREGGSEWERGERGEGRGERGERGERLSGRGIEWRVWREWRVSGSEWE